MNHIELFISQYYILVIELISDSAPPILVSGSLNELVNLIRLLLSHHWLRINRVAHVFMLLIPLLRDIPCPKQHLFV